MHDTCQTDIVIIQGDTYQANVTVEGVEDLAVIENVYFSCSKLEMTKELTFDPETETYVLLLSSEETSALYPQTTNFDITVKFFDSKIKTGLYRGKLIVCDKNNPVEVSENNEQE